MQKPLIWTLALSLVGLSASAVRAHQDRAGDVHPKVRVEGGRFAVYFTNNQDRGHYRSLYSADGQPISERVELEGAPALGPAGSFAEKDTGLAVRQGADWLVMPDWQAKHKGRPGVIRIREGKVVERIALNWGRAKVHIVHAFCPVDGGFVVLASTEGDEAFHLYAFTDGGKGVPRVLELGVPRRIYDFPRSSSLSLHRGRVVVCWLTRNGRLVATRWDPAGSAVDTLTLREEFGWNTSLDAAVLDDRLFVAWHGPGEDGCRAVIHTLTRDLSKTR